MFRCWQIAALCLLASQALISATPIEEADRDGGIEPEWWNESEEGSIGTTPDPSVTLPVADEEEEPIINEAEEPSLPELPSLMTAARNVHNEGKNFKKCAAKEELSLPLTCNGPRLGRTRDCPAVSCRMILELFPLSEDGIYFCHVLDKREREIIFPVYCLMSEGGFTMVTKIPTTTNATSAADFWLGDQEVNEGYKHLLQLGQPEIDPVAPYKNRLVRHWRNTVDWKVAKVALIKNGRIAHFIDFNVQDSDRDQWFAKSRVIRSSWRDLISSISISHFSVKGLTSLNTDHTFLIGQNNVGNCGPPPDGVVGWMVSIGERPGCSWERPAGMHGLIWLYSTGLEKTAFNDIGGKIDIADSLVVLLR